MKRISILVAVVALAPAVGRGSLRYSERYHIRYSPYAFNYRNSGLIPGAVKYSPYAFNARSTGLAYEGVRYTPYAFNYRNAGLVVDYHLWHAPCCTPCQVVVPCSTPQSSTPARRARRRPAVARGPSVSTLRLQEIRQTDGEEIVRRHLQARGLDNVHIDRRLRVENRTAGAAFILRDKNLVVRYTNPDIMESLEAAGGGWTNAIERYEQRWETFADDFEARGGTVYCVDASEPDQIVAALAACPQLAPDFNNDPNSDRATMIAKAVE